MFYHNRFKSESANHNLLLNKTKLIYNCLLLYTNPETLNLQIKKKKFFTCMCPSWDVFFRAFVKRASVNIVITRTALRKKKRSALKVKKNNLENVYQNCLVMYIYQYINCIFTCTFLVNKHVYDSVSSHNSMASLLVMHTDFWNTILIKIDPIRW